MLTLARGALRRLRVLADRAVRRTDGVSAVEFALLAPVLALMFGGVLEMSGAITAANRSTYVADAVAEMVSRADHTLTDTELYNYALSSVLVDPDIIKYAKASNTEVEKAFKITISSVQFEPKILTCLLLGCVFDAKVVFSYTLNGTKRSCGKLTAGAGNAQTISTLPLGVYGPGSLIVVDVETFYSSIMPVRLTNALSFKRTSYFRPRYVSRINSEKNCNGY